MKQFCGLAASLALLASLGCGGSGFPDPVPVSGTVTYQGDPVSDAKVTFLSKTGGRSASGTTDAQGSYTLTTFNTGDGAIPDDYTVTIAKFDAADTGDSIDLGDGEEDLGEAYGAMMDAAAQSGEAVEADSSELPAKYASAAESGIERSVAETGPNEFNFELE